MVYGSKTSSNILEENEHISHENVNDKTQDDKNWEHPWSTGEIRKNSTNWTLAGDVGLLNCLQEFSQQLISKTHEIEKVVDSLVHETKGASAKVNNVINDFHMLSNLQFVENRVYDEDLQDSEKEVNRTEHEKTKEEKETEMLQRVSEALNLGLSVLDKAFEKITVDEISDSEDEEDKSESRTILEPKDPYESRPLPYIIGTQEFQKDDFAGLHDILSEDVSEEVVEEEEEEEGSLSITDESDEEEEEEEAPPYTSKVEKIKNDRAIPENAYQNESDSEGSDLFNGEIGENGYMPDVLEEKPKENKTINPLLEELISKTKLPVEPIKVEKTKVSEPLVIKEDKKASKKEYEAGGDLFVNEDEFSDDDVSPFRKKTGLFTSDAIFDDEKQELDDDLFKKNERAASVGKERTASRSTKQSILFDDESDEDPFQSLAVSSQSSFLQQTQKSSKKVESDENKKTDNLSSSSSATSANVSLANKFGVGVQESSDSLFGDESDDDDLFSGAKNQKIFNFNNEEEEDSLFSTPASTKKEVKDTKVEAKRKEPSVVKEKRPSLFEDSDNFDLFTPVSNTKEENFKVTNEKNKEEPKVKEQLTKEEKPHQLFFEDSDTFDLFNPAAANKKETENVTSKKSTTSEIKTSAPVQQEKKSLASLFEDSDTFDLFSPAKKESFSVHKEKDILVSKTVEKPELTDKANSLVKESSNVHKEKDVSVTKTVEKSEIADKAGLLVEELSNIHKGKDVSVTKTVEKSKIADKAGSLVEEKSHLDVIAVNVSENVDFDKPIDSSSTLNALNKDRVKIQAKRRKPTRKGRQTLHNADADIPIDSETKNISEQTNEIQPNDLFTSSNEKEIQKDVFATAQASYKAKEREKKDLMSQLISEAASSKVGKKSSQLKIDDKSDDLFSSPSIGKKSTVSDVSFDSSPPKQETEKVTVKSDKSDDKSAKELSNVLDVDSVLDDDDLFSNTAFKDFSTSISDKHSLFGMDDDDDDDIFKSAKKDTKSVRSASQSADDIPVDPSIDIFAGVEKEKYEMFPTQIYDDDDDDDIFSNTEKPSKRESS